jgi:NTE family protein
MIPLMIKFPQKRMVFFWGYQSYLLSSDYTNEFQPFNIAKGDFGVAAAVFKRATIKYRLLVLLSVMKACFNFVLGGLWFIRTSTTLYFYGYDFFKYCSK